MPEGYLDMPWGRMAFHDRPGTEPALVFLHGTGCDPSDFDGVLSHLPAPRALRVAFRAHGGSAVPPSDFTLTDLAEDVLQAVQRLELASVILVGHSLGGMVALEVAQRCGAVASLVLLEGWTRLSVVRDAFPGDHMYGHLAPETVVAIQARSRSTKARVPEPRWSAFWKTVQSFDASGILARLAIPIHQVYGSAGAEQGAQSRLAVPERPNIHWHWISDAGHYLPTEAPAEVAGICARLAGG